MEEAAMGLASPGPDSWMPYSVSMPHTFGMATAGPYPGGGLKVRSRRGRPIRRGAPLPRPAVRSEVLARGHTLDGATTCCLRPLPEEGPHVHDPLTLLARDLGPVVGVGGVGQVLVLLVLLLDGVQEVGGPDALALAPYLALEGQLLGPAHDVLDHGPRGEVLEVERLLVAALVGDLEEAVGVIGPVHLLHRGLDHGRHGLVPVAPAALLHVAGVDGQVGAQRSE